MQYEINTREQTAMIECNGTFKSATVSKLVREVLCL